MNQRRRLWWWLAGGACVVIAWLLWPAAEKEQVLPLSDGSYVRLAAVTYGKEHKVRVGTLWERVAARLPNKWFPKWPRAATAYAHTPPDSMVVWIQYTNRAAMWTYPSEGFVVAKDGTEMEPGTGIRVSTLAGKGWLIGVVVRAYPRAEAEFQFKLAMPRASGTGGSLASATGSFVLRNPGRVEVRSWRARALPQVVTNGGLECELVSCELNVGKGLLPPLVLGCRLRERGAAATDWWVESLELEDQRGNCVWTACYSANPPGPVEPMECYFARGMAPGTGPWLLHLLVTSAGPSGPKTREFGFLVEPKVNVTKE